MAINQRSPVKEFYRLMKNIDSMSGGQAHLVGLENSEHKYYITVMTVSVVPDDGLYKDGEFIFEIKCSEKYPVDPPDVNCKTLIYHPNIYYFCKDCQGEVCLNMLSRGNWSPSMTLEDVVQGILFLMYNPNLDEPFNTHVFVGMDENEFAAKVRQSLEGGLVVEGHELKRNRVVRGDGGVVVTEKREVCAKEVGRANADVGGAIAEDVGGTTAENVGGATLEDVGGASTENMGRVTTEDVGGPTSRDVGRASTENVGGVTSKDVGGPTTGEVSGASTENMGGAMTKNVGGVTTEDVGGPTTRDVGRASTENVGGVATEDVGRASTENVGGVNAEDVGRTTTDNLDEATVRDVGGATEEWKEAVVNRNEDDITKEFKSRTASRVAESKDRRATQDRNC